MRNQFISEFIFRTTGKRRSAKQVGSRLQQLRDTFEGKRCKPFDYQARLVIVLTDLFSARGAIFSL